MEGPLDSTAANYRFLSAFSFSQPHVNFCSHHHPAAMCIHHPPSTSLLPSTQLHVAEVFTCPFCPQLFSWSLTPPSFQTTFTSFFHHHLQSGGKRTAAPTNQPCNHLTPFPHPQSRPPMPGGCSSALLSRAFSITNLNLFPRVSVLLFLQCQQYILSNVHVLQTIEEVIGRNTGKSLKMTSNSSSEE